MYAQMCIHFQTGKIIMTECIGTGAHNFLDLFSKLIGAILHIPTTHMVIRQVILFTNKYIGINRHYYLAQCTRHYHLY